MTHLITRLGIGRRVKKGQPHAKSNCRREETQASLLRARISPAVEKVFTGGLKGHRLKIKMIMEKNKHLPEF